jgi:hypothetical protein
MAEIDDLLRAVAALPPVGAGRTAERAAADEAMVAAFRKILGAPAPPPPEPAPSGRGYKGGLVKARQAPYSIPPGLSVVSTTSAIQDALRTGKSVVAAAGEYPIGAISDAPGHVYARPGERVVLRGAAALRGSLTGVDVAYGGQLVGERTLIHPKPGGSLRHVELHGDSKAGGGVVARASRDADGITLEHVGVFKTLEWGFGLDNFREKAWWPAKPLTIRHVYGEYAGYYAPAPGTGKPGTEGTREAGFWLGLPAVIETAEFRRSGWQNIWVGAAAKKWAVKNALVEYSTGHNGGFYLEHDNDDGVIEDCSILHHTHGIYNEWNYGSGRGATLRLQVRRCLIDTTKDGIYCDEGTQGVYATDTLFRNQRWAAFGNFKQGALRNQNEAELRAAGNVFENVAKVYTTSHVNSQAIAPLQTAVAGGGAARRAGASPGEAAREALGVLLEKIVRVLDRDGDAVTLFEGWRGIVDGRVAEVAMVDGARVQLCSEGSVEWVDRYDLSARDFGPLVEKQPASLTGVGQVLEQRVHWSQEAWDGRD